MSAVTMSDADQSGEVPRKKRGVPEGLWISCEDCKNTVFRKQVEKNLFLCPDCNYHFTVPGRIRIQQLLDEARRELARKYLADARYSVQQVAGLLGFEDDSNFFRACRRWFGVPPGQYRERLASEAAQA